MNYSNRSGAPRLCVLTQTQNKAELLQGGAEPTDIFRI